jgi:uncharacterized RDD family membrane protein YckC
MSMEPSEGSTSPSPGTTDVPPVDPTPPEPPMASAPPAAAAPVAWESPEMTAGPAPGIEFAPHGARLVAYIFDGIIIGIVVSVIALIGSIVIFLGATYEGNRVVSFSPASAVIGSIILFISILVGILYFPYFWSHGGRTLGMRPFNLRVVRDSDGGAIGWGTAFLRLLGLWVAGLVFYLGYIWIFIDKRRRGWQDLIAGTVMIKQ